MKRRGYRNLIMTAALIALCLLCSLGHRRYAAEYQTRLGLEVAAVAEYTEDGVSWSGLDLAPKQPLKNGTRFQVNFRPLTRCYAYLVSIDSHGKLEELFPREKDSPVLEAGRIYTLPSPSTWYTASKMSRNESLRLVVSGRRLSKAELGLERNDGLGRVGEALVVPLSDGKLHQTHWQSYRGRGIIMINWTLQPG